MSYLISSLTFVTLLIKTYIDWPEKETLRKRLGDLVLLLIGLAGMTGTWVLAHHDKLDAAQKDGAAAGRFDQMRKDLTDQTSNMSARLQDLSTRCATAPLQQQISSLQGTLGDFRSRLAQRAQPHVEPQPKATLVPTLWTVDLADIPKLTDTAGVDKDSVAHFSITIFNQSETVKAANVSGLIRICELCSFASETPGLTSTPGTEAHDREFHPADVLPQSGISRIDLAVKVPSLFIPGKMEFGVRTFCDSCINSNSFTNLTLYTFRE